MTKELIDIHSKALEIFNKSYGGQCDGRRLSMSDRKFYSIAGAQWDDKFKKQFENKPKLEVNKIHMSVIRIINEYRNNRISVDFISKDGTDRDELADVCNRLFRSDEQDSSSEEAYDNAF